MTQLTINLLCAAQGNLLRVFAAEPEILDAQLRKPNLRVEF
ncbi:hypothetical protein Tam1G_1485 [Bifidobacterium imperatoris]|uniref:Uncharacterized protein n=1 Tax=Bifidobacterium imperatoris TaxID=2020965 RepID=A0A2N5IRC2_9BIFI|nr:hypothetical protein Tam1G_1485 [Bifidobacterium imperatoris]